jgi:hypothetical protein
MESCSAPASDVDLFADWQRRADFPAVVDEVIDAAITSGRCTFDQLCDLAHHADAGFDRRVFATMLARIERLDDLDFTEYGVSAEHVAAIRARVFERHRSDRAANRRRAGQPRARPVRGPVAVDHRRKARLGEAVMTAVDAAASAERLLAAEMFGPTFSWVRGPLRAAGAVPAAVAMQPVPARAATLLSAGPSTSSRLPGWPGASNGR